MNKTVIDVYEINHVRTVELKSNEECSLQFEPVTSLYWSDALTNWAGLFKANSVLFFLSTI